MCRRSTLAATLKQIFGKYCPIPLLGAIWSPRVAIFREAGDFAIMATYATGAQVVGVVSTTALCMPSTIYGGTQFGEAS